MRLYELEMSPLPRLQRIRQVWQEEGPRALLLKALRRASRQAPPAVLPSAEEYAAWIAAREPDSATLERQREASRDVEGPLISILTPVYNPDPAHLEAAVESVLAQTYPHWELCLADGASDRPGVAALLEALPARDERIRVLRLERNRGISGNSNAALEMARGEFAALLDQDDLLAPDALYEVAQALRRDPALDLIYSDHDLISADGSQHYNPLFKPDWSPEVMLSANYITHLTVLRTARALAAGGFDPELDGAQDWDLFLRLTEPTPEGGPRVGHIPRVLYHWRSGAGSTADDIWAKSYSPPAQLRALTAHLRRLGLPNPRVVFDPASGFLRAAWDLPDPPPLVSIIIPSKGAGPMLRRAVCSIQKRTDYPRYEIVIVNNGPRRPERFSFYRALENAVNVRVVHYDGPFNYNTVNNFGAQHSRGDLLLFLNNDIEVLAPDWLTELALWATRPEVGAVGAKLLFPNRTIQHAGVIIGLTGFAGHIFAGRPENQWSVFGLAEWYRSYLAVTAACVMLRREVFESVGGFDESFLLCGSDVALCLRLWDAGLRVVYNPFARLVHWESATRGPDVPAADYACSYPHYLPALQHGDPYFNPNLSYWHTSPALAAPTEPRPLDFVRQYLKRLGVEAADEPMPPIPTRPTP